MFMKVLLISLLFIGVTIAFQPSTLSHSIHRSMLIPDLKSKSSHRSTTPSHHQDPNKPPTIISKGCFIDADRVHLRNGLVVEGTLKVHNFITSPTTSNHTFLIVNGILEGHARNVHTVHVEGRMEGSVHCQDLIVGCDAIITGDVTCQQLNIRPGGQIEGKIICDQVESESHVFQRKPPPLPEVSLNRQKSSTTLNTGLPTTNRDRVVQALHAMSDRQAHQNALTNYNPQTMSCPDLDIAGNPLLGAPKATTVESYRKNRKLLHKTQQFLGHDHKRLLMQRKYPRRDTLMKALQGGIPDENAIQDLIDTTQKHINKEKQDTAASSSTPKRVIEEQLPSFWKSQPTGKKRDTTKRWRREFKRP